MRASDFIAEDSDDIYHRLGKYFNTRKILSAGETAEGIWIKGDLVVEIDDLHEFPFQISTVTGSVRAAGCDLRSLKNFPHAIGGKLAVQYNKNLTSLASDYPITCDEVSTESSGILSLDKCKIDCDIIYLEDTPTVTISGFEGSAKNIMIIKGAELNDSRILNTRTDKITLVNYDDESAASEFGKMKLCQLNVMDTKKKLVYSHYQGFRNIMLKYQGLGPKAYIPLLNELRDAGFGELAKRG